MTAVLSPNTQAILLLTAPLIAPGGAASSPDLLSPGEYKRLARHLREIQRQPADFVSPDAADVLGACRSVIDESRMQRLLGRGFLLSQVIERWQARAVWVVSRADAGYPRRLKIRLREDAPAVLYGCGDMSLLDSGGLAVVGSRHVDDVLIDYAVSIGRLAARAGRTIVSGGAKGIDQAAMRGALEAGGTVCGVLADGLEKSVMNRENRNVLLDGRLVLISPYDPNAGFNVGNAMQRNKLIYAFADASLVVSSDINKGGTWAGAVEQLGKLKLVPVFVRSTGEPSAGLDALRNKGALPWPNPQDVDSFAEVFDVRAPSMAVSQRVGLSLIDGMQAVEATPAEPVQLDLARAIKTENEPSAPVDDVVHTQPAASDVAARAETLEELHQPEVTPAETLFSAVREAIRTILILPMKDAEVAAALGVTNAQTKAWLQRLVDEGAVEKMNKPVRYRARVQTQLFENKV